ncbi:MAG: ATP-binding cassette, subfamily bacterial [Acidimicrobiaceae bacterium]|nr:ATP-binding cassette, subfamily bacterial [Acidimicrobiaceae bacterium]
MPLSSQGPWRALLQGEDRSSRPVLAAAACLIASVVLPLAGPQLIRSFVDGAISRRPTSFLLVLGGVYLVVAVAGQAATVLASYLGSRLAWTFTNRLRERLAEHTLGLDMDFHAGRTSGEMIERVDGDIVGLNDFLSQFVVQALAGALLLAGTLVLVAREDLRVGLALAALVAAGAVAMAAAQRRVVPRAIAQREATAQQFGALEEALVGAEDLRANAAGPYAVGRFLQACGRVYRAEVRWQITGGAVIAGTNLLFSVGTAVLVGLGIVLLRSGSITVGTVVLLFQYAQIVRQPVEQIAGQAKQLQQAGAAAGRVADLLGEEPTLVEPADARPLPADGPLEARLRSASFAYLPGETVLHRVDLVVPAGRSLGLVGRTGSGKSTIARMLLRLYDPDEGAVEVGGVDLRLARTADIRGRVRMVTQDVQLFGASVRDNVTLFDPRPADDAVRQALEGVGLGEWLLELPDGLDTVLGPGALGVSAGEAQLLAFARVFLADPGLVVLDEASSRLDLATELLVSTATDRLLTNRTAVVVAHRLSSLDRVDDIAVIDGGRIVEHGPRQDLAGDRGSRFATLLRAAGLAA